MSSQKRKRSASLAPSSSQHLPPDATNIHSHSANTLKQLRTAGLTDNDLLPATYLPNFPHRSLLRHNQRPDNDDEEVDDEEEEEQQQDNDAAHRASRQARDTQTRDLALLTATVQRALAEGHIARAHRAFALVRRAELHGRVVDLRRHGLWSLGAEVLIRRGEDDGEKEKKRRSRWGTAGNLPALRAYLEELARLYPWNRLHPMSVSALDFYPVLFGCEVYDAWAEYRIGVERAVREWDEGGFDGVGDDDDDGGLPPLLLMPSDGEEDGEKEAESRADRRLRDEKGVLARRALASVRDVVGRMDLLMEAAPYQGSVEMLRLRAMAALFVGDLAPVATVREERNEALRVREEERMRARGLLAKMKDSGGRVDGYVERWLRNEEDDDAYGQEDDADDEMMGYAWSGLPVFSSLPVR